MNMSHVCISSTGAYLECAGECSGLRQRERRGTSAGGGRGEQVARRRRRVGQWRDRAIAVAGVLPIVVEPRRVMVVVREAGGPAAVLHRRGSHALHTTTEDRHG